MGTEDEPRPRRPSAGRPRARASAPTGPGERATATPGVRPPATRRRRTVAAGIVGGLVLVVAVVLVVSRDGARPTAEVSASAGSCQADTRSDPGSSHVQNPTYGVDPPSGGDHDPVPAAAGTYGSATPRDGQLVHSLEHGYVVVWYRPGLAAADMAMVADTVARFSRDVLLVPRAALPVRVAATAWHQRLLCDEVDPAVLARFIDEYRNNGPERIPH